eukprot:11034393-Alexandrium_andersonii.AAC.1
MVLLHHVFKGPLRGVGGYLAPVPQRAANELDIASALVPQWHAKERQGVARAGLRVGPVIVRRLVVPGRV